MTARAFDEFAEAVRAVPGCQQTKARVLDALVSVLGGQRVRVPDHLDDHRGARHEAARRMLRAGNCRADVVRMMVERFGVSERTAYLDVTEALKHGPR